MRFSKPHFPYCISCKFSNKKRVFKNVVYAKVLRYILKALLILSISKYFLSLQNGIFEYKRNIIVFHFFYSKPKSLKHLKRKLEVHSLRIFSHFSNMHENSDIKFRIPTLFYNIFDWDRIRAWH